MKTFPTIERKLDDWRSVFDSISDKQHQEARILKGLMNELQYTKKKETVVVSS